MPCAVRASRAYISAARASSSVPCTFLPPPALASSQHLIDIASQLKILFAFFGLMRRHALAAARVHGVPLLLLVAVFLLLAAAADGIRPSPYDAVKAPVRRARGQEAGAGGGRESEAADEKTEGLMQEEVYATGSSLPDCSHACGACKPCSRVMVSFKCSIAEPCPMVYRCMCKGKCYPVPSS
uniref:Uncharacterized protein n=1 Tax=Avena sativa TaxID=4498 RepID=A0ACD5UUA4_AVESA